jgi:hypothetical protein
LVSTTIGSVHSPSCCVQDKHEQQQTTNNKHYYGLHIFY